MNKFALASMMALAFSTPAMANDVPESNASVYAGFSNPTNGFADRAYTGFFYNQYLENGLGLHAEGTYVDREENGALGVVGVSAPILSNVRAKVSIGTSTDVHSILPELVTRAEVKATFGSTVITPEYTYREYRTGVTDHKVGLNAVQYLNIAGDDNGYYVVQAGVSHSMVNRFKNTTSGSFGVSTVRSSGVQFGISGEYGELAYATILEGIGEVSLPVESKFYAVRPSLSVPVSNTVDLFLRGEFSHNKFYETTGLMGGLKFKI